MRLIQPLLPPARLPQKREKPRCHDEQIEQRPGGPVAKLLQREDVFRALGLEPREQAPAIRDHSDPKSAVAQETEQRHEYLPCGGTEEALRYEVVGHGVEVEPGPEELMQLLPPLEEIFQDGFYMRRIVPPENRVSDQHDRQNALEQNLRESSGHRVLLRLPKL